jgi:predicted peptidase
MIRMVHVFAALISLLSLVGCGSNPANAVNKKAPAGTGFALKTFKLSNGDSKKCTVFVPFNYDPQKQWPTIVFLQGVGEGGSDGVKNTTVGLGPAIAKKPETFDFIAVFPQSGGFWTSDDSHQMAIDCLNAVEKEYSVDKSRVYLTGLSTGGKGVWLIGAKNPGRFAALVPMCAYSGESVADKLTKTPVWAFHNAGDMFVPAGSTKATVKKINSLGGHAKQTIYGAIGHDCWGRAYNDPELFTWLRQQRIGALPSNVAGKPAANGNARPAGN